MINLYIFNETSRAAVYGIGTYIRELTTALQGYNISICVIHLHSDKPENELNESDTIQHWYIPAPVYWNASLDLDRQNELYYRNVAYLLQLQIKDTENLVFHLNYIQCRPLSENLRRFFSCKIILTIHYLDWGFRLSGNTVRFRQILVVQETDQADEFNKSIIESYRKEKELFEMVDHIICLSRNTQQILQNDYWIKPDKTTVVYNGLTGGNSTLDKPALRKKYHIPDIPIILFAGRLDDIKGLTCALQAFKTVLNTQQCHIMIAGNGSFDKYMKECEDIWMHVTWTGLISKAKLYDLYSIADIGIMPSFHEQCSYVAIEMMMHGVPIIASTSTGLKEMVEDGIAGLHVPVEEYSDRAEIDSSQLAEKILYLLQYPKERKRMGVNARKHYEAAYGVEIFRKNMLHLYESLFISTGLP
ncbi:MAG: TIGR04157 family glycosyltransferase [Tannerella sp.]|jgi:glycosyltransferase|nr:TIGR04157 family glycosyltransferase [Tannerella sp.]